MRTSLLDVLRCPYCGGRLDGIGWASPPPPRVDYGVLSCACCAYPIVEGIPVMALGDEITAAIRAIERNDRDEARHLVLDLPEERRADLEALRGDESATFARAVRTLLPDGEGDYYVLRFGDPTFTVADAVTRTVVARRPGAHRRLVDVCGGCGHLTHSLVAATGASGTAPILLDRSFWRLWLASRFVAPAADVVCCDANTSLPLASGCASLVVCNDAIHYIWGKRLLATDMQRLAGPDGDLLLTHSHSMFGDNATAGNTLAPSGYAALLDNRDARVAADEELLRWAIGDVSVEWRRDADSVGTADAVAVLGSAAWTPWPTHPVAPADLDSDTWVITPLLSATPGEEGHWSLAFPSSHYGHEFAAARTYLPRTLVLAERDRADLAAVARARPDLVAHRVLLRVPRRYL